jgi:hypothetical protein
MIPPSPRATPQAQQRRSTSFQKLDSIPEGVQHVDAVESFEGLVRDRGKAGCLATGGQFCEASHQKRGVGLPCRMEIRIHAQVEPKSAAPEPRTPSPCEIRRLHFFRQPKHARVEGSRRRFLALRHRQLDVIEVDDFTHNSNLQSAA